MDGVKQDPEKLVVADWIRDSDREIHDAEELKKAVGGSENYRLRVATSMKENI